MAQLFFLDPIVSVNPLTVGVGNGTLTVDKLTHFTITQTYTLTCIAKAPDTLFAVTGSLDGPVGIAVVATQFFDQDLKVFLTITQGATPFEIGDVITFSVINGTDLNQDNIDDYDEYPQKNFGLGTKGTGTGDHNLRFDDTALSAYRYIQDLKFEAVTAGSAGNNIQVQYLDPVPPVPATLVKQDITYTYAAGSAGNLINVTYIDYTPASKASKTIQNLSYVADNVGSAGNSISIEYTAGGTAGAEVVTVTVNAISVQIDDGVSTAAQIKTAIDAFPAAAALVDINFFGLSSTPQSIVSPTFLLGGLDVAGDAGFEIVTVSVNDVTVQLQNGVSTATQVKAKLDASLALASLGVTTAITGVGSNTQTAPDAQQFLVGGVDGYGYVGFEEAQVTGNLIKLFFESGLSTATQVKAAFDASVPATALASCTISGSGSHVQFGPYPARNLIGGKNLNFLFNRNELTDSMNFVEGNASVKLHALDVAEQIEVSGHAKFKEAVELDDQNADNYSGPIISNLQQFGNNSIQNQKITLRLVNEARLAWTAPNLTFSEDIILDYTDTDFYNIILSANSPIAMADGESAYVILNRRASVELTPIVATTIPQEVDAFRLASRFGDHIRLWDGTLIRNGKSARPGEGGGTGGITKVTLYDPVSTTLPTGVSATIDGVSVVNDDLVLFSNLSSGNNEVYQVSGVGVALAWDPQTVFETGLTPAVGDMVIFEDGTGFKTQIAIFDGTNFKVNDVVRYFNGVDYWEVSSLKTSAISNNTTGNIFTVAFGSSENIIMDFSIIRGTTKETGTLHITTDGTNVAVTTSGAYIGLSGVSFFGDILASDLRLRYTTDNSGTGGTVKYFIRRWSDTAGGPGGPPSYSGGGGGSGAAAGSSGDIQYNAAGLLSGDSDFTWDDTNNVLGLATYQYTGLQGPVVLTDNTINGTVFSYSKTTYPNVIVKFSIIRDGERRMGRMLVVNNGTIVSSSDDSVFTNDLGITLTAVVNGANIDIRYDTTVTGFNASFKYAIERWS